MSNNMLDKTIAKIVAENYKTAEVFKEVGIDFCCGGKKTLRVACAEKNLEPEKVIEKLTQLNSGEIQGEENYNDWSADFLADYIVNKHHGYINKVMPSLEAYAQKVASVHGDLHPELVAIRDKFLAMTEELKSHMIKEENELFPYIKELAKKRKEAGSISEAEAEKSAEVLTKMEKEHEDVGDILKEINKLSHGFEVPDNACNTYRVFYSLLNEFEGDLYKHIHLENNILFPKVRLSK